MKAHLQVFALVTVAALTVVALEGQVRDGGAPAAGTAVITGTVLTDGVSSRPLARAIVTVTGSGLRASRSAISGDDGRFAIRNLPPGRVTIGAAKRGYVSGAFGARRPGRPGTPTQLVAGQTFDATIHMSPAGVLTGLIRDERGEPVPGLRVFAIDAQAPVAPEPGGGRGGPGTGVETDDRGVYRIFDLAPGNYLIAATPTHSIIGDILRRSPSDVDGALSRLQARDSASRVPATATSAPVGSINASTLAVMFFPGTAVMADAARVRLTSGEVRDGLDFVMTAVPVTTIEGDVVSADGRLPATVEMSIVPANTLRFFALSSANPQLSQRPGADGRFKYTTIVPGHYMVLARASGSLYAAEAFDVVGTEVTGVTLRLQRGSRFSGRVAFDATTHPVPTDLSTVRVAIQPTSSGSMIVRGTVIGNNFGTSASTPLRADGTFEIAGIAPGSYRVTCTAPAAAGPAWWLRSVLVENRDALDSSLDLVLGTDVTNAALTLTDRHSELSGTLQTAGGLPATDYFIIAFPADPLLRTAGSRRIRSTRPATDGHFNLVDLPAGDYLLVALTDVEPNEWQRAEFLAEVAPASVKLSLGQGEKRVQDLKISGSDVKRPAR